MFLVLLLTLGVSAETTTQSYQIPIRGSNPITIIEGEPIWRKANNHYEHRSLKFHTTDRNIPEEEEEQENSNEEDDTRLNHFLNSYEDKSEEEHNTPRKENNRLSSEFLTQNENPEKSKSWNLINYQNHNHPYDDKKGWVTMEPVPWSISKISKWHSNYKPKRPWENNYEEETRPYKKPPVPYYDSYYAEEKPKPPKRPSGSYGQKVHATYEPHKPNCQHEHHRFNSHEETSDELITDDAPPDFPHYESNRRRGTEMQQHHPESHPFSGEGDWVLLSRTKGYKYPQQRQRSLKIKADSLGTDKINLSIPTQKLESQTTSPDFIGTHRTVRLTVLPPLKDSKINMTTSHGGLLQVESSFETVEQAHKQYKKQQQKPKRKPLRKNTTRVARPTATVTTRRNSASPDSSAVLAAVGAGMIPATMAMLVPMAMGGRRKRDIRQFQY